MHNCNCLVKFFKTISYEFSFFKKLAIWNMIHSYCKLNRVSHLMLIFYVPSIMLIIRRISFSYRKAWKKKCQIIVIRRFFKSFKWKWIRWQQLKKSTFWESDDSFFPDLLKVHERFQCKSIFLSFIQLFATLFLTVYLFILLSHFG